jgi:hypothetical protein
MGFGDVVYIGSLVETIRTTRQGRGGSQAAQYESGRSHGITRALKTTEYKKGFSSRKIRKRKAAKVYL